MRTRNAVLHSELEPDRGLAFESKQRRGFTSSLCGRAVSFTFVALVALFVFSGIAFGQTLEAVRLGGISHILHHTIGNLYSCPVECHRIATSDQKGACRASECSSCVFCTLSSGGYHGCPNVSGGGAVPTAFHNLPEKCAICATAPSVSEFDASHDWCKELTTVRLDSRAQLKGTVVNNICYEVGRARQTNAFCGRGNSANVLIFSLGYDSPFWLAMNANGITRFVEHEAGWVSMQPELVQAAALLVQYNLKWPEAESLICRYDRLSVFVEQLPRDIRQTCWDIIIVDAPPQGFDKRTNRWAPGRMESIYAARALSAAGTVVYLDDAERAVESSYFLRHLAADVGNISVMDDGHGGFVFSAKRYGNAFASTSATRTSTV